jgi:hypothetical protein
LVDTGAQFSCIRRDLMKTLAGLGVKATNSSCRLSCPLANGLRCDEKVVAQLRFLLEKFYGISSLKY